MKRLLSALIVSALAGCSHYVHFNSLVHDTSRKLCYTTKHGLTVTMQRGLECLPQAEVEAETEWLLNEVGEVAPFELNVTFVKRYVVDERRDPKTGMTDGQDAVVSLLSWRRTLKHELLHEVFRARGNSDHNHASPLWQRLNLLSSRRPTWH